MLVAMLLASATVMAQPTVYLTREITPASTALPVD